MKGTRRQLGLTGKAQEHIHCYKDIHYSPNHSYLHLLGCRIDPARSCTCYMIQYLFQSSRPESLASGASLGVSVEALLAGGSFVLDQVVHLDLRGYRGLEVPMQEIERDSLLW